MTYIQILLNDLLFYHLRFLRNDNEYSNFIYLESWILHFAFFTSLENVLNVKTRIIKRTNVITIRLKIIIVVIFHSFLYFDIQNRECLRKKTAEIWCKEMIHIITNHLSDICTVFISYTKCTLPQTLLPDIYPWHRIGCGRSNRYTSNYIITDCW